MDEQQSLPLLLLLLRLSLWAVLAVHPSLLWQSGPQCLPAAPTRRARGSDLALADTGEPEPARLPACPPASHVLLHDVLPLAMAALRRDHQRASA